MNHRAYKFYLRPTREQARHLDRIRLACCELYNAALEEKRDAWNKQRIGLSCAGQQAELTDVKRERPDIASVYAQVLQDVIKRLHRSFVAFYRRTQAGEKPGYPRFRSVNRYDSFTFPQVGKRGPILRTGGVELTANGRLRVHGLPGALKVTWHREMAGQAKTATFRREGKRWYVIFACDNVPREELPKTGMDCGIDLGLIKFATTDDGVQFDSPRFLLEAQGKITRTQRIIAKRTLGSKRRRKAIVLVGNHHRNVANARRDHAHKTARILITNYDRIAIEKLNVTGLGRSMLSGSVHDVGWGAFINILTSKAENAGREIVVVDPRGTSQECSGCGVVCRKKLSERVHRCGDCGLVLDRDVNAARNIRARAFGAGSAPRRGPADVGPPSDPRSLAG